MKKYNIYMCLMFVIIIFIGCGEHSNRTTSTEVQNIAELSDGKYIATIELNTEYYGSSSMSLFGSSGRTTSREYYLATLTSIGTDLQGKKKIELGMNIFVHGNIACYNNMSNEVAGIAVLDLNNYNQLNFYERWSYELLDFSNDNKRFLLTGLHELNTDLNTTVSIGSLVNVIEGKYNPIDQQQIAYIERATGDVYTIRTDSSANTLVITGQNATKLYWNPDGNTIAFMNASSVYTIDKSGTGLIKMCDYTEPIGYTALYFSYNKLVFAVQEGLQITNF